MPIDDLRTRTAAARPVAAEAHEDVDDPTVEDLEDDDGEPGPTRERLAEIETAWIAESVRRLRELDDGLVQSIPWEEAQIGLFDPPAPEDLAESSPRRARR